MFRGQKNLRFGIRFGDTDSAPQFQIVINTPFYNKIIPEQGTFFPVKIIQSSIIQRISNRWFSYVFIPCSRWIPGIFQPFFNFTVFISFAIIRIGCRILGEKNSRIFICPVVHRKFIRKNQVLYPVQQIDIPADNFFTGPFHHSLGIIIAQAKAVSHLSIPSFGIQVVPVVKSYP